MLHLIQNKRCLTFLRNISKMSKQINSRKLKDEDFDKNSVDLAQDLLGKVLVRALDDGTILKGRIVETECYLGGDDKASRSCGGKRTPQNEPMYMKPGTAYVYLTYGMYHCFNISCKEPGATVFLRALEPISGQEQMIKFRTCKKNGNKPKKESDLCNGPSKLCIAMDINKANTNAIDLAESDDLWLEDDPDFQNEISIVKCPRIGIASAGPIWMKKPLRFYVLGNTSVSKRDKKAEEEVSEVTKDI